MFSRGWSLFVRLSIVLLFLGALQSTAPLWAQYTTASLGGRVVDSSGAVVPGAKGYSRKRRDGVFPYNDFGFDGREPYSQPAC